MDDHIPPGRANRRSPVHPVHSHWLPAVLLLASPLLAHAGEPEKPASGVPEQLLRAVEMYKLAADNPLAGLEQQMLNLVNADRAQQKLPPYTFDAALAAVARSHSLDMLQNRFFGHESPTTGFVADRVFAAHIRATACSENIAMHDSVEQAQAGLMASPGHRANILSGQYTHCGIGLARTPTGSLYVTQVFSSPAPEADLPKLPRLITDQLNARRLKARHAPVKLSPALCRIAADQAAAMARTGKQVNFDPAPPAKAAGLTFRQIGSASIMTWTPIGDVSAADPLLQPQTRQIGLGFAQNTAHKQLGYGIVWTVVIFTNE